MKPRRTFRWYNNLPQAIYHFFREEITRGTLLKTLLKSFRSRSLQFEENVTLADLLKERAKSCPEKPFIFFGEKRLTFGEADSRVNQFAHFLAGASCGRKKGIGIMIKNCPDYLMLVFAAQRLGACTVTVNTALVGDGLAYQLDHSDIEYLVIDADFLPRLLPHLDRLKKLKKLWIRDDISEIADQRLGDTRLGPFPDIAKFSSHQDPSWSTDPADIMAILYTSGTTGAPKGIMIGYDSQLFRKLGLMNHIIYRKDDVLYTCLPLFHANALFLTTSASLWLGIPIVLSERFSASRFWLEVNQHKASVFNVIGAMIPILIKQPSRPTDCHNSVRLVLSAACPAEHWRTFEQRFGVQIWESYAAVDGGQRFTFNMGNAPVGSIGKPLGASYRIIDEQGGEVAAAGVPGELIFKVKEREKPLEYYKDKAATNAKVHGGYLHTGDLVYRDRRGFLYFVGRKTESMRRRGENVSAFEVENALSKYPDVLECAAYGVPSELGEDDIMCAIVPVEGRSLDPAALLSWASHELSRHAIPRYVRICSELPKTSTHRVQKNILAAEGITPGVFDRDMTSESDEFARAGADFSLLTETERVILRRRSTRAYHQYKSVPDDYIRRMLEAARFAPSAGNCQPWRFIVINNRGVIDEMELAIKEILAPLHKVKDFTGRKRDLFVATVGLLKSTRMGDLRPIGGAIEVLRGRLRVFHDAPILILVLKDTRGIDSPTFDSALACQNLVLTAHALGLGTCYIGFAHFLSKQKKWMKRLGISYPWEISTAITVGYPKYPSDGPVARDRPQIDWINSQGECRIIY